MQRMNRIRNGLLITAIFTLAACCTVCGTRDALAVSRLGVEPVQSTANKPDTGEPDSGSTRNPPKTNYRPSQTDRSATSGKFVIDGQVVMWVAKVWITKFLGTGL
jgi:hypothetical protein